jgi:type IV pilus secretin PilQ/predicted competence protein
MSFNIRRLYFSIAAVAAAPALFLSLPAQAESNTDGGSKKTSLAANQSAGKPDAISVASSADSDQLSIITGSDAPRFSVQQLSAPPRLVVDIEGATLGSGRTISSLKSSRVSSIRVGAHPNKTRVVIDLKGDGALQHNAQVQDGKVVVTLFAKSQSNNEQAAGTNIPLADTKLAHAPVMQGGSNTKQEPAQKVARASKLDLDEDILVQGGTNSTKQVVGRPAKGSTEVPSSPGVKPQPASTTTEQKDSTQNRAQPKAEALVVPAIKEVLAGAGADKDEKALTKVDQAITPSIAQPQPEHLAKEVAAQKVSSEYSVTKVSLNKSKGVKPSVVVGLKGSPDFSLNRTAPSEYVLTLRNTSTSAAQRKQTLFGARDGGGIRSVRTTIEGQDTLVRIFTQPSSYLTARKSADELIVEETQDLAEVARDIRAQLAPDPTPQDAAKVQPVKAQEKVDSKAKKELPVPSKDGATAKEVEPQKVVKEAKPESPAKEAQATENVVTAPGEKELAALKGDNTTYTGRLISLDLQDADIDSALRIIAEVSNLNIVAGDGVAGKVTLKLVDVPWDQALDVILKSHGLDKVLEGNVMRVAPIDKLRLERESLKQARVAEEELESLSVKYMRVSYAKASEIKALVETVLSERGSVAFDERSNQLIVKDVRKGLQNVSELVKKIDLRTPQILLETQIVEANRSLSRQLGSELGFQYIQSPATGNGTGLNFPAAIAVGGSADTTNPASILGSAFPVASSASLGSAVTMLFDSADGTKSLSLRLSQLEQEGQVRIISKPAVATTNNKPAEIKSVEKFRVKLPNGGLSIATGSGAQSTGAGNVATQTIEAGIVLNVTPQASPDYYILLDINAKSSTFGSREVDGIPNEIERSASSSVLVSSGQTFALGGIYKIVERDDVTGVPFFKDIPVLGTFFRKIGNDGSDEELLFFITPRIVEGSFEEASVKANQ